MADQKPVKELNEELVKDFFRLINAMGNDTDLAQTFYEHLYKEHRTLQQSALRVFKTIIEKYSLTTMDFSDARNEAGLKWAKEVKKAGEEHYLPFV